MGGINADMETTKYIHPYINEEITTLSGFESFCYQNCQRILLQAQGIREGALYVNAALSLRFDKEQNKLVSGDRVRSLLPEFDENVTRTYHEANADPQKVFEQNLAYMQENNTPIIVGLDTFFMPYATNFGKNHARHTLLFCGYDSAEEQVYVIDWYPDWYYKGPVKKELFLQARASENESDGSIFSGGAVLNNWAEIHDVKQLPEEELLTMLLRATDEEYYRGEDEKFYYGPDAIAAFRRMAAEFSSTADYAAIKKFVYLLVRRYRFFKQYLICFDPLQKDETIRQTIEVLEQEAVEWDKLSMLAMKGCIAATDKVKERVLTRIDSIMACDENLRDCINQLNKKYRGI